MEIAIEIDHPKKKEICTLLVNQFNNLIAKSKQSEQESESLTAKINRALKKFLGKVVIKDLRLYIYIYGCFNSVLWWCLLVYVTWSKLVTHLFNMLTNYLSRCYWPKQ